jgi:hypothetical protein
VASHEATENGLTLRVVLLSIALLFAIALWMAQVELIAAACFLSESVPSMPAIAALLALVALRPLFRRVGAWLRLSRAETLAVYVFLSIGILPSAFTWVRWVLRLPTVPFYFATPENGFLELQKFIPAWAVPHDAEVVRTFYEGSDSGAVPWAAWALPMAAWLIFFVVFWVSMMCLVALFRKQWTERERLTFPLLFIPLSLTETQPPTPNLQPPFLRNPLMWLGFGCAFFLNLLNILRAFNPAVPALGREFNIGAVFTEAPLNTLNSLTINYRWELVGLGYLVSTDVLFTTWFLFFVGEGLRVVVNALGWQAQGFPHNWEQGSGVCVALVLFMFWTGRHHLRRVFRKAFFGDQNVDDSDEPMPYRFAVFGVIIGFTIILAWLTFAGMALWVAALFLGIILTFALVCARVRAETGTPALRLFPQYQARDLPLKLAGSDAFMVGGSAQTLTVWNSVSFLAVQTFIPVGAYHLEFFRLSEQVHMPRRQMPILMTLALVVGMLFAFWTNLTSAYQYGANVLGSATFGGDSGIGHALGQYNALVGFTKKAQLPQTPKIIAVLIGFLLTGGMLAGRAVILRFPLNPIGYAVAAFIGYRAWAAFFMAWSIKVIVLKMGGVQLYKRLIPAFLGFALGEFFTNGVLWGILAPLAGEAGRRYFIWYL